MKNNNIIIGIFITVILFLLLISSVVSSSKYENKKDEEKENIYEEIVREISNINDNERKTLEEIDVDKYIELYNKKANSIVLFSNPTCKYCKLATPILENIEYENEVKINYLNTAKLSEEDNSVLISSNDYFKGDLGIPLLLVVRDGKIIDKLEGIVSGNEYLEFIKNYS